VCARALERPANSKSFPRHSISTHASASAAGVSAPQYRGWLGGCSAANASRRKKDHTLSPLLLRLSWKEGHTSLDTGTMACRRVQHTKREMDDHSKHMTRHHFCWRQHQSRQLGAGQARKTTATLNSYMGGLPSVVPSPLRHDGQETHATLAVAPRAAKHLLKYFAARICCSGSPSRENVCIKRRITQPFRGPASSSKWPVGWMQKTTHLVADVPAQCKGLESVIVAAS
jgi:hypothetical protein